MIRRLYQQAPSWRPGYQRQRAFVLGLIALIAAFEFGHAAAQEYPSKAIRIIVPFPAGSAADVRSRSLAHFMSEQWKQSVIVENRPGAGGNIAASHVAKAPPDGYTLLYANSGQLTINPSVYRNPGYDAAKDFVVVTQLALITWVLVVHPAVPANTVQELIALAKKTPGALSYASSGSGTPQHLAGELFKKMASVDILHVPYKGENQSLLDLLSGRVTLLFATPIGSLPHIKANKLRALAVSGKKRLPSLPAVPTLDESVLPGYESTTWGSIAVPAKTPAAIVKKLNTELTRIMRQPQVEKQEEELGNEVVANSSDRASALVSAERERNAKLVKELGLTVE